MKHSKRSLEGYLLIDNRVGPRVPSFDGTTPEIPQGATWESATLTCSHCHRVAILYPNRSRPLDYCHKCDKYMCRLCAAIGECRPLNAVFDRLQNAAGKLVV